MTLSPITRSAWGGTSASERLRIAWQERHETDYIFRFSTAFGWFVITGGVYGFYILYQLMRRSTEHNRRRYELLDAAAAFSWQQAKARGLADELRPNFERISDRMRDLGALTQEFRDPTLWTVVAAVTGGIAQYVAWVRIDRDLVTHDAAERAIEIELAAIYTRIGWRLTRPEFSSAKEQHRVPARIIATVASLGLYSFWWMRDVMTDGNEHFESNWNFEDELARASQSLLAA